jgi:hypothetical protein
MLRTKAIVTYKSKSKRKTTRMERQAQVQNSEQAGLLCRQLASITDTLAKASQRRDAEVQERERAKLVAISAMPELSVTSDTEVSQISDSDDNDAELMKRFGTTTQQTSSSAAITTTTTPGKLEHSTLTFRAYLANSRKGLRQSQVSLRGGYEIHIKHAPKKMLADLDESQLDFVLSSESQANEHHDPERMLAKLSKPSLFPESMASEENPKAMLAELKQEVHLVVRGAVDGGNDNLEASRAKLSATVSPLHGRSAGSYLGSDMIVSDTVATAHLEGSNIGLALDRTSIPYAVALALENADCRWEDVNYWTEHLFSSGSNGYVAQQQKNDTIKQVEEELDALVQAVIQQEVQRRQTEETERLRCRITVSNIAADAGEEEVRLFLRRLKFDM